MKNAVILSVGILAIGAGAVILITRKPKEGIAPVMPGAGAIPVPGADVPFVPTGVSDTGAPLTASDFYTPSEANKKAMDTVLQWKKMLDEIPASDLTQKNLRTKPLIPIPQNQEQININLLTMAFNNKLVDKTLRDFVTRSKNETNITGLYNTLAKIYTRIQKSKVDRLVTLYPRYIFANPDFQYFTTYDASNPIAPADVIFLNNEVKPLVQSLTVVPAT